MTDKLSYEIIGLVALIDRVKQAANIYLCNEERIANTTTISTEHSSKTVINDINERLSELGSVPCDNESLIIASGCSGFEPLTNFVNQDSLGTVTAALQVQGGVLVSLTIILLHLPPIVITLQLIFLKDLNLLKNGLLHLYHMTP